MMMSHNFSNRRVWLSLCGIAVVILAGLIFFSLRIGSGSNARAATTLSESSWFTGTQWQAESHVFRAPAFALPSQSGKTVSLRGLRGKVVLLTFTSSVCKGQCPLIGRAAATADRMLGPLSSRTVLVNISVDPEADAKSTVADFMRTTAGTVTAAIISPPPARGCDPYGGPMASTSQIHVRAREETQFTRPRWS
jgi:cytochrome oxidase Cu insertion factor (SCO1/SenC/PrrC family)